MFLEFFIKLILFSTSVKEKVFWFLTMKMNEYKAIEADAMQQPSEVLLLFQRYAMALFLYTRKECLWLLPILIFSLCCFIMSWVYVTSGSFRVFWWVPLGYQSNDKPTSSRRSWGCSVVSVGILFILDLRW